MNFYPPPFSLWRAALTRAETLRMKYVLGTSNEAVAVVLDVVGRREIHSRFLRAHVRVAVSLAFVVIVMKVVRVCVYMYVVFRSTHREKARQGND